MSDTVESAVLEADIEISPIIAPLAIHFRDCDDFIESRTSGGPSKNWHWSLPAHQITIREYWRGRKVVSISERNGESVGKPCWRWDSDMSITDQDRSETERTFAKHNPWVREYPDITRELIFFLALWAGEEVTHA